MKKAINVFDYSKEILKALHKGIFITTKAGKRVNCMVISWGSLGIEWGKPIFTIYVKDNRFTKKLLDENSEFTVNIPLAAYNKEIFKICGTKSGAELDKIKAAGLTLIEADKITVPAVKEFPLTLECKVIYKEKQEKERILKAYSDKFYPKDEASGKETEDKNYHTAYYGQIVSSYIIEEEDGLNKR